MRVSCLRYIFFVFVLGQARSKCSLKSFRNNMKLFFLSFFLKTIFSGNVLTHMSTLFPEKKFPLPGIYRRNFGVRYAAQKKLNLQKILF